MDLLEQANALFSSNLDDVKRMFYLDNKEGDLNIHILGVAHDIIPGETLDLVEDDYDRRLGDIMLACPRIRFDLNIIMGLADDNTIINMINSGRVVSINPLLINDHNVSHLRVISNTLIVSITNATIDDDDNAFDNMHYFLTSPFNACSDDSISINKDLIPNDELRVQQIWKWVSYETKINIYVKYGWSWSYPTHNIPDIRYTVDTEDELLRGIQLNLSMDMTLHLSQLSSSTIDVLSNNRTDIAYVYEFYEPLDIIIMAHISTMMNTLQDDHHINHDQVTKPSVYLNIQLYKDSILSEWKYGIRSYPESRPHLLKFIRDETPNLLPLLDPMLTDDEFNSLTVREKNRFGIRGSSGSMSMFKF